MDSAPPKSSFDKQLDKVLLEISKHHDISSILEQDDECRYIVGNQQAIAFARPYLMGEYGSVVMTIKQYEDGLDPWAIKQPAQSAHLGNTTPTRVKH